VQCAVVDQGDVVLELSVPAVVPISSDSGAFVHSEDDPSFQDPVDQFKVPSESEEPEPDLSNEDSSDDFMSDLDLPAAKQRKVEMEKRKSKVNCKRNKKKRLNTWKQKYDMTRRFQTLWAAKLPWSEGILKPDGLLHMVRCKIYSHGRKECVMAPKWDTLNKHGQRECHRRNALLYAARQPTTVLEQIQGCSTMESRRKRVQLSTLFSILCDGRPMPEYVAREKLYEFLNVPDHPSMHWSIGSGWLMSNHIWDLVKKKMIEMIKAANFIAITADETSANDNTSWVVIHVYIMQNWSRMSLLCSLQKMTSGGATADMLTQTIIGALSSNGGLEATDLAGKLLCFGADGASAFQGHKNGVVKQMREKYAPFVLGVHCCAHKLNLCAKSLSNLGVMHALEDVLQASHGYFAHSPKKAAEFRTLAELMETKGLKLLKNVKTRWISCIAPLRRLISEFKSVMAKMHADKDDKKSGRKAQVNILLFLLD
jgi:hypothetical protein